MINKWLQPLLVLIIMILVAIVAVDWWQASKIPLNAAVDSPQAPETSIDDVSESYYDPDSPRIGPEKAALTLVYFTDYSCPYCKRFEASLNKVAAKYPNVNVVIKPLPYLGNSSRMAAEAALTVWQTEPEKFASVHHDLMAKKGRHSQESIQKILAKNDLAELYATQQVNISMRNNVNLARSRNINGVPATLVGDRVLNGAIPYKDLETAVAQALKKERN